MTEFFRGNTYIFVVASVLSTACGPGHPVEDQEENINSTQTSLVAAAQDLSDYVAPPGSGLLMHKSCVHEVPTGSTIQHQDDGAVEVVGADGFHTRHGRCAKPMIRVSDAMAGEIQPPFTNGWIAYSEALPPSNQGFEWFTEISGDWVVPANPIQPSGGLVYFFNGLQSAHGIIQPVLQWGYNNTFGGAYWTYASWHWYSDNGGGAYFTTPQRAQTGDYIAGDTWATNCNSAGICNWTIRTFWRYQGTGSSFVSTMYLSPGSGKNTVTEKFNRAEQGVLETHWLTTCDQYPADGAIVFKHSYVYEPKPTDISSQKEVWLSANWSATVNDTYCSQRVRVPLLARQAIIYY